MKDFFESLLVLFSACGLLAVALGGYCVGYYAGHSDRAAEGYGKKIAEIASEGQQ